MKKATIILLLFSIAQHASAWGKVGHRTVAELAFEQLNPIAKRVISQWMSKSQFIDASTFMDDVRADTSGIYGNMPPWHFITVQDDDLPPSQFQQRVLSDTAQNAYKSMLIAIDSLKKKPNNLFWLKVIIHLVGDVHQPLHVGRRKDYGGNLITVDWYTCEAQLYETNLHSVWDDGFIHFTQYSQPELVRLIIESPAPKVDTDIMGWCYDSYRKRDDIYKSSYLIPPKRTARIYQYAYYYDNLLITQLKLAGARLAAILNEIYTPRS